MFPFSHFNFLFGLLICQVIDAGPLRETSEASQSVSSLNSNTGLPKELIFNAPINRYDHTESSFNRDTNIWRVHLPRPITFLERKNVSYLWVHMNGFISLDDPSSSSLLKSYPSVPNGNLDSASKDDDHNPLSKHTVPPRSSIPLSELNADIIAPFVVNNLLCVEGVVRVRTFSGPVEDLRCDHKMQYLRFQSIIQKIFPGHGNFTFTTGVVVNWENMVLPSNNKKNHYELVLINAGEATYAIFHYVSLGWVDVDFNNSNWRFGVSGFTSLNGLQPYYLGLPEGASQLLQYLTRGSNVGVNGEWIFKIGGRGTFFSPSVFSTPILRDVQQLTNEVIISEERRRCMEHLDAANIMRADGGSIVQDGCENQSCHHKAVCVSSMGRSCCKCRSGWLGNGTLCLNPYMQPIYLQGKLFLHLKDGNVEASFHLQVQNNSQMRVISLVRIDTPLPIHLASFAVHQLNPVQSALNSLFATEIDGGLSPFSLTGLKFELSLDIVSNHSGRISVTVSSKGLCPLGYYRHSACDFTVNVTNREFTSSLPVPAAPVWIDFEDRMESESKQPYDAVLTLTSPETMQIEGADLIYKSAQQNDSLVDWIRWNGVFQFHSNCLSHHTPASRYYVWLSDRKYCRRECEQNTACKAFCLTHPKIFNKLPATCDLSECDGGKKCVPTNGNHYYCVCPEGTTETSEGQCRSDEEVTTAAPNCADECRAPHTYCDLMSSRCVCERGFKPRYPGVEFVECEADCELCQYVAGAVCHPDYGCVCKSPEYFGNGTFCSRMWVSDAPELDVTTSMPTLQPPHVECYIDAHCERARGPETCLEGTCHCALDYRRDHSGVCVYEGFSSCDPWQPCTGDHQVCQEGRCQCAPGYKALVNYCVVDCAQCASEGSECSTTGCICRPEYEGNGTHCKLVDKFQRIPCVTDSECTRSHEMCINHMCQCDVGWIRMDRDCVRNPDHTVRIEPPLQVIDSTPGQPLILQCIGPKFGRDMTPTWDLESRPELRDVAQIRMSAAHVAVLHIPFMKQAFKGNFTCRPGSSQAADNVATVLVTMKPDPCREPCSQNAYCHHETARCICLPGYAISSSGECSSHNCASNPSICGENALCQYNSCVCKPGYVRLALSCVRANNCKEDSQQCHKDADCEEVKPTVFQCKCRPNFVGDGVTCYPATFLCSMYMRNCPKSLHCGRVDSTNITSCICPDGLVGNAHSGCWKLMDCETEANLCPAHSACVEEFIDDVKSRRSLKNGKCACDKGYVMRDGQCFDGELLSTYLIAAVSSVLYRIPLLSPEKYDISQNMWAFHTGGGIITHLVWDCNSEKLYWTTQENRGIFWLPGNAPLNTIPNHLSLDNQSLPLGDQLQVSAMAVDSASGNLYIADNHRKDVLLYSQRTKQWRWLKLLDDFPDAVITSMAVDASGSVLFWATQTYSRNIIRYSILAQSGPGRTAQLLTSPKPVHALSIEDGSHKLCWSTSPKFNLRSAFLRSRTGAATEEAQQTWIFCDEVQIDKSTSSMITVRRRQDSNFPPVTSLDQPMSRSLTLHKNFLYLPLKQKRSVAIVDMITGTANFTDIQPPCCGEQVNAVVIQTPRCAPRRDETLTNPCDMTQEYGGCRFLCLPKSQEQRICACPGPLEECDAMFVTV